MVVVVTIEAGRWPGLDGLPRWPKKSMRSRALEKPTHLVDQPKDDTHTYIHWHVALSPARRVVMLHKNDRGGGHSSTPFTACGGKHVIDAGG